MDRGYSTTFDVGTYFQHDVPADVLAFGPQGRQPSDTPFGQPCSFRSWPDVPLHVITSEGDRFFPRATLSHPVPIAELLCGYLELDSPNNVAF